MGNKEALVIGLGITGCSAARMLADAGYSVTCFERASHVGGRLFEDVRANGIRVQVYGPRIFHTDNESVYRFLKRFGSFYPYRHRVLLSTGDKTVPLPLNSHSLEVLFGENHAHQILIRLQTYFPDRKRISSDELIRSSDEMLIDLGRFIIENILTLKINRQSPDSFIPADDSYANDAMVDIGTDDCYYEDSIQAMPMQGFLPIMESMLDHPAITTYLNMDALSRISILENSSRVLLDGVPFNGPVIFTPSVDRLFDYKYGALPYRATKITFHDEKRDFCNESAVIVTPKDPEYVRITESKQITLQDIDGHTTLSMETPYETMVKAHTEPFEPEITEANLAILNRYMDLLKNCTSLIPLGRMATYRNMSIAESIEQAQKMVAAL
ncbi:MAG: NAD(P)-binding protein [Clostridiales bacterium]|nr:NAD(P)-binding protein [Clostridiales bacterium]